MLKCWDFDLEDRPTFTKIGSNISKALLTMEGYLDVSAAGMPKVPPTQDEITQPVLIKEAFGTFRHWVVPPLCCALIGWVDGLVKTVEIS